MIVRPDQLHAIVARSTYPVYMVSGDEPLQQMESLDCIRAYLRDQSYLERDVLDADARFDWQQLMDQAASMSLFSERRIVELRLPSAKPGRQGSQAIKDYLSQPPEDVVLIINAGKIDTGSKKSAWYKAVEKQGLVVQCWPVPSDRLSHWLKQRFNKRKMEVDNEVLTYISQHVEGNLLAADQEIEKLSLVLGPGKISYSDVAEAVTSQSRYNVFELADMLLQGNRARVIKIIAGLKAEGVEPVVLNWALAKDIRMLSQVSADKSANDFQLKRLGIWQSRIPFFKSCLSRHSQRAFQMMLKRCAHIDAASKGMINVDVWDEIEKVSMRLASSSISGAAN